MDDIKIYIRLASIFVGFVIWFVIWSKVLDVFSNYKEYRHGSNPLGQLKIVWSALWIIWHILGVLILFAWSWS